jgi:hypothetical protein
MLSMGSFRWARTASSNSIVCRVSLTSIKVALLVRRYLLPLSIQRALHRTKRKKEDKGESWILRGPKTFTSRRTIRIPALAIQALRKHRARQHEQRLLAGDLWIEGEFYFEQGPPLDVSNLLSCRKSGSTTCGTPMHRFSFIKACIPK